MRDAKIWAKVLAGEANSPGLTLSARLISGDLDKQEAFYSQAIGFGWQIGNVAMLFYDDNDPLHGLITSASCHPWTTSV